MWHRRVGKEPWLEATTPTLHYGGEKVQVTVTKLNVLFARFLLAFALLIAAAPLTGCDSGNKLPDMHLIGDKKPVTTGQYNVTRGAERNWFAMKNTGEYVLCWSIILVFPWLIILGVTKSMFGKLERPGEVAVIIGGTFLMYRWASSMDLEPWILLCWVVPCIISVPLYEHKKTVFLVFTILFMLWSVLVVAGAVISAFTYHPILMIIVLLLLCIIGANLGDGDKKAAEPSAGHGH